LIQTIYFSHPLPLSKDMGFVFKVTDLGWEYYLVEIITEVVMDY
jgi:hypothetical protein